MWKRSVLVAVALSAGISAGEARQSTLGLSCQQATALVRAQGAVVLSTGRHTYNRFVSRGSGCLHGEYADRGWAPTQSGRCLVGYVCRPGRPGFDDE